MLAVDCPAPEDLEGLLDGSLAADRLVEIEAHVDECSACRVALGELAGDAATVDADDTVQERPISTRRPRGALPMQIDRYKVERKLGAGGMGVVLLADDPDLGRKVVIKLLHPELSGDSTRGRQRLMREAQAMAKVSHPNVVSIFDVGVYEDQVFIAMEYLDGGDLAKWLEKPHSTREILDVFIAAGRGVAAAHRAGLVHRDFKPHNVILGSRGEVKVSDFGLARPGGDSGEREAPKPARVSLLDTPITRTGVAVGTPAYMPPEQILADAVDARADQFSFCVALYQALYGQLPFKGTNTEELLNATLDAKLPEPAGDRRVSRKLRRLVGRGLASKPDDRYASMDALLHDLAPRPRWVLPVLAAAVVVGGAFGGIMWMKRAPNELCTGSGEELATLWNAQRRHAIEQAFGTNGKAVVAAIDQYGEAWRGGHRDACRATRVRGDQTEAVMDQRMHCLRQRRQELAALLDVMDHPDEALVADGGGAVSRLTSPAVCANVDALGPAAPSDPVVEADVAKATALVAALRYQPAAELLTKTLAHAQQGDDKRIVAEIEYELGTAFVVQMKWAEADPHLQQAAQIADEVSDDRTRALALIQLVGVATALNKLTDAARWYDFALAAIKRLGNDKELTALLQHRKTELDAVSGQTSSADAGYTDNIRRTESTSADSPQAASAHRDYGSYLTSKARYDEAIDQFERANAIMVKRREATSPEVGATLTEMAFVRGYQHRYPDAEKLARDALVVMTKHFGADDPMLATTYIALGNALQGLGKIDEAIKTMAKGVDLAAKLQGEKSHYYVSALMALGTMYGLQERRDEGIATFQKAFDTAKGLYGTEDSEMAVIALNAMGSLRRQQGKLDEAAATLSRSRAIIEKLAPKSPLMGDTLTRLGVAERYRKHYAESTEFLEEALAIANETASGPNVTGWVKSELAQAVWDGGGDHERAKKLAGESIDELTQAGDAKLGGEMRTWLDKHRK